LYELDAPEAEADRNGTDVSDTVNGNLTVGEVYRFVPPRGSATRAGWALYAQDFWGNVTYSVRVFGGGAAERDVLMNTATGFIQIAPSSVYTSEVHVTATDSTGVSFLLSSFTFSAHPADTKLATNGPSNQDCSAGVRVDTVRYDSNFSCDCDGTLFTGALCTILPQLDIGSFAQTVPDDETGIDFVFASDNRTEWAQNEEYRIAPINVTVATVGDVPVTVRYALVWDSVPTPRGFFIDSNTGEMFILIPGTDDTRVASVLAQAEGTIPQTLFTYVFNFKPSDVSNTSNGPGNRDCTNGGQRVDAIEFDNSFTCDCSRLSNVLAPNCDAAPLKSKTDTSTDLVLIGITIGVVVFLSLVVFVVSRYQVHRARNRPHDMAAMQADILESMGMGMGGAALDVNTDELGFSFTFDESIAAHAHDNDDFSQRDLADDLLEAVRRLSGLPSRLSSMLKDKSTSVTINAKEKRALIRMKRPTMYRLKPRAADDFASALQHAAIKRQVSIDGGEHGRHFVEDIAVAIPRRVPKELDRRHVLRLGLLGDGNFGEVTPASCTHCWIACPTGPCFGM
jgi:hypothetical protein